MGNQSNCLKCSEPVDESASKCPHCGYEPSNQGKYLRGMFNIVGILLCMTLVGAIIGIPMLLLADYSERKTGQWTPATKAPS